ncbi:NTP pyrophosphohydrolase [Crossiella sp. SN42]|uniref:NTP pyrophosphohydrolase n=1 Tax=Crossiella sp. SN42 TaxID=2944808 RepID=UPI00207C6324|nr:NTP pyrophosphohydrolase [Crossiella sp. SN42]MCO1577971.1 NTP pyrophosphohydrolase [Crossiella sp. SN42]
MTGLVIVDAANVVGSVPDGWWRDRAGATARLLETLNALPGNGLPPVSGVPEWALGPVEVVLVVEGKASRVAATGAVRVVAARGSGDDAIVDLVRAEQRPCLVVTADRGLRERVLALGAAVTGPSTVRPDAGRGAATGPTGR